MTLAITIWHAEGRVPVTVLCPQGELDASNYQDLISEGTRAYEAGARDILLDLGGVAYMSSSGLVALQSLAALLRGEPLPDPEAGWGTIRGIHRDRDAGLHPHFKLANLQPRVDRMLDTVGFKRYLEVLDNLDTAVAAF